ncbi:MAG: hypothetical protein JNK85_25420 [Verrucomicrobiales bacterium]|nr:hypothetical protein [Verrucomicrobiales bacterium]
MTAVEAIQDAGAITIEAFERLIRLEEKRRDELLAELTALRIRAKVIGATQDATWIQDRFVEPRLNELRQVDRRIEIVREKLDRLRDERSRAARQPFQAWVETGSEAVVALAA